MVVLTLAYATITPSFFQGVGQCDWMPSSYCDYFWGTYRNGRPSFISKKFESLCWSEENPDAYFPRRRLNYATSSFGNKNNDRYLQDASYLRLKNLTFGYTIPFKSRVIEKCGFTYEGEMERQDRFQGEGIQLLKPDILRHRPVLQRIRRKRDS